MAITSIYAAILALLYVALSANVIRTRGATGVSLGAGSDKLLERRIRAHGNFAEYVPLALILIALLELSESHPLLLHGLGVLLLVGRGLHATALSRLPPWPFGRVGGLILTFAVLIIAAVRLLIHGAGLM